MARILLIDDDDIVRKMLCRVLSHAGHIVIEACDGSEGLAKFSESEAELVITDLVMPEKEGLEVIMELRKLYPNLKIIAISGGGRFTAAENLRIARYLGAVTVLGKPFTNIALLDAVRQLIPDGAPDSLAVAPS
jgi:two-component system, chemotaxis family, chemotaxis protein CheY